MLDCGGRSSGDKRKYRCIDSIHDIVDVEIQDGGVGIDGGIRALGVHNDGGGISVEIIIHKIRDVGEVPCNEGTIIR